MWIQLQLNLLLPPVSILIGKGGLMHVKLVNIGQLLKKLNPYSYQNGMKSIAVQGKDILPLNKIHIPPKTLNAYVVPMDVAFKIIMSENVDMARLFMKQLREGMAHQHRFRKFATREQKAPLLVCVDKMDDKCVSVPHWIEQFIKDLEDSRAKFANRLIPEKTFETKRTSETQMGSRLKKRLLRTTLLQEGASDEQEANHTIMDPPAGSDTETAVEIEPTVERLSSLPTRQNLPVETLSQSSQTVDSLHESFIPVESGDLIVRFHTLPKRLCFVLGEKDEMYRVDARTNQIVWENIK